MNKGFWAKLKRDNKPITALAPMANVTDAAFRRMVVKYSRYGGADVFDRKGRGIPGAKRVGGPDVMWTEFVSCEGLLSAGRKKLLGDLVFDELERPIVAQVFGSKPEQFSKYAELIQKLGFDGIDINMGCPDRSVVKQGAGAALINEPKLAQKLIKEIKKGAGKLPVSVKTRIGDTSDNLQNWLPYLLEMEPAVVTIHARTRKERFLPSPANWKAVKEAVKIRNKYDSSSAKSLIIGNGGISSMEEACKKAKETGADGIMVGRAAIGNPWFFNQEIRDNISPQMKILALLEHAVLFENIFKNKKNFDNIKKHLKAYINGFKGAKEIRIAAMEANNAKELEKIIESYSNQTVIS